MKLPDAQLFYQNIIDHVGISIIFLAIVINKRGNRKRQERKEYACKKEQTL